MGLTVTIKLCIYTCLYYYYVYESWLCICTPQNGVNHKSMAANDRSTSKINYYCPWFTLPILNDQKMVLNLKRIIKWQKIVGGVIFRIRTYHHHTSNPRPWVRGQTSIRLFGHVDAEQRAKAVTPRYATHIWLVANPLWYSAVLASICEHLVCQMTHCPLKPGRLPKTKRRPISYCFFVLLLKVMNQLPRRTQLNLVYISL